MIGISSDIGRIDSEKEIWIKVEDKYEYMLNDITYDCCLALPVYMAMFYKTDLYIHGKVSKKLHRNVNDYVQPILCSFSRKLSPVSIYVDGYAEIEGDKSVNGTGISCGVDSHATVYKYFQMEKDSDYKLTHLFFLNCGWHGAIDNSVTEELFEKRAKKTEKATMEMGLSFVRVDSNLHAFLYDLDDQASYFNIYTIVFALERAIGKYYLSSSYSYEEVMRYGYKSVERDFSEYGYPMTLPLYESESIRLISDGCQYSRSEKPS